MNKNQTIVSKSDTDKIFKSSIDMGNMLTVVNNRNDQFKKIITMSKYENASKIVYHAMLHNFTADLLTEKLTDYKKNPDNYSKKPSISSVVDEYWKEYFSRLHVKQNAVMKLISAGYFANFQIELGTNVPYSVLMNLAKTVKKNQLNDDSIKKLITYIASGNGNLKDDSKYKKYICKLGIDQAKKEVNLLPNTAKITDNKEREKIDKQHNAILEREKMISEMSKQIDRDSIKKENKKSNDQKEMICKMLLAENAVDIVSDILKIKIGKDKLKQVEKSCTDYIKKVTENYERTITRKLKK